MVTNNGGYAIVKHNDSDIFSKVKNAFENEKPILFYDDDKTCFYVDSVKLNGDGDYEFTKGGKTWTVTDNNTLSSEGQIQNHLYRFLVKDVQLYVSGEELRGSLIIDTNYDITDEWKAISDYTTKEDLFTKLYNFIQKNGAIHLYPNGDTTNSSYSVTIRIEETELYGAFMSGTGAGNVNINATTINDGDTSSIEYVNSKIQLF